MGGYLRAMYDCMALAIQTDSTRVVTYTIWGETTAFVIPETGVKEGHHNLTHNNNDPLKLANLAKLDTYLVQQFAYFLDKLKNATEGEGSLLDATMCMYGSGASMTHIHYHLPILFAGGSKLGLRHGQHLDLSLAARAEARKSMEAAVQEAGLFDGHKINRDARLCNLLLTIGQKMGLPIDSFRDSTGPIKELLA